MRTMVASSSLYTRVAKKVLQETLSVKKGEAVTVESWNNGLEVARVLVAEARAMGCTAVLVLEDERAYVEGVRRSPRDSLGEMGRNEDGMLEGTDAYVFIPGPLLATYQTRINPKLLSDSTRYNESWYDAAGKAKLKGARLTFGYIGEEMARMMGRTVQQVEERQLSASLVDFGDISKSARRVSSILTDDSEASMRSGGSSLGFTLKGETTIEDGVVSSRDVKDGNNMTYVPPGFVSKGVDSTSASGTLKVSKSVTRLGLLMDAKLTFKEGRLVTWKSRDSMQMLDRLVKAVPEDKRRLTTLMVGINPKMDYLFGQDRMVAGSVTVAGFGFTAVVRGADLTVGGRPTVTAGKL
jgi:leucyl aminopeptidase (aminopeptidase T)